MMWREGSGREECRARGGGRRGIPGSPTCGVRVAESPGSFANRRTFTPTQTGLTYTMLPTPSLTEIRAGQQHCAQRMLSYSSEHVASSIDSVVDGLIITAP